jgi:PTS system nitrogen regulatory IIA component
MKLLNYTQPESWMPGLVASSQRELFESMLTPLCRTDASVPRAELQYSSILTAIESRETQNSTAMGNGVAFPHARLENLASPIVALGVLPSPILFGDQETTVVCLILVPQDEPSVSLKIMASLSKMLRDERKCQQVAEAQTPEQLKAIFEREDLQIDQPILARDIMHPPSISVTPETPIREVASLMSARQLFVVPVLDAEGHLLGDITASHLFRYGIPDFFTQLKSISFIAEFEPFETYFKAERVVPARDLIEQPAGVVPMSHTLMEIVFDLAIRHLPQLYVVDGDNCWVGTIDPGVVLHNVINY